MIWCHNSNALDGVDTSITMRPFICVIWFKDKEFYTKIVWFTITNVFFFTKNIHWQIRAEIWISIWLDLDFLHRPHWKYIAIDHFFTWWGLLATHRGCQFELDATQYQNIFIVLTLFGCACVGCWGKMAVSCIVVFFVCVALVLGPALFAFCRVVCLLSTEHCSGPDG